MTADDIVENFRNLDTASISDALDKLRLPGSAFGIRPLFDEAKLAGRAFTVKYVPKGANGGAVGDFLDDVPPGYVAVLDNDHRLDCTVWGDIMTTVAISRGIAGTVIAGVCRDTALALKERYPMFTCGRFMRTGKDRVEQAMVNVPVNIGGVQVKHGDVVIGNSDGVVIVPQFREKEVLDLARMIETTEQKIIAEVKAGKTLREARAVHGYHKLQTPSNV